MRIRRRYSGAYQFLPTDKAGEFLDMLGDVVMILAAVVLGVVACVLGGVSFVFSEPLRGVSPGWFISWAVVFGCVAVWVLFFLLGSCRVSMISFGVVGGCVGGCWFCGGVGVS